MEPIPQTYRTKIIIGLVVAGGLVALIWFKKAITAMIWPEAPQQSYQAAQPAKGMSDPPTETVTPTVPLKTYNKKKAAEKMDLPPEVVVDPKSALLQTAKIKPTEGGNTVAAVLDTTTGNTTLIVREDPRSLFGFGGHGEIGGGVGVSLPGGITGNIYISQNIVRVSKYQIFATAEVNASELRPVEFKGMLKTVAFSWN